MSTQLYILLLHELDFAIAVEENDLVPFGTTTTDDDRNVILYKFTPEETESVENDSPLGFIMKEVEVRLQLTHMTQ